MTLTKICLHRMVEKYTEVEQAGALDEDGEVDLEPSIKIEKEVGVELFWDSGTKSKDIRELALGASDNIKEDADILKYYRWVLWCCGEDVIIAGRLGNFNKLGM